MTWFKVDDKLWHSKKVRRLGKDKTPLSTWVLAGSWSSKNLTDGFVPWEIIEQWDPRRKHAATLLVVDLWVEATQDGEDGIRFHDWHDYNRTAEEIKAERAAGAERQRKLREARRTSRGSNGVTGNVTTDVTSNERPATPTRPDPTRSLSGDLRGGVPEPAARENRPPERCSKHRNDLDAPPCAACGAARRAAEAWDADAPKRLVDERLTIRACPFCDADGWRYAPGTRIPATPYVECDHTRTEVHA